MKKLIAGVNVYTNFLAFFCAYGGMENDFNWNWILDVLENKQNNDLVNIKDVYRYIDRLKKFPHGAHPFVARFFRAKKNRKKDATFFFIPRD